MKKFILLAIVLIGLILRFYMLGANPPSLNWDEASTGYNAYSILKTGKDEYGTFLPLSIRSFDDYKPPLYTYLTVPSIAIFGLNDFAVRFPSAVLGTLTIIVLYFLVLELLSKTAKELNLEKQKKGIALVSAFLFAVSPWSLQFSRAAYEGNIGLFFILLGFLFMLKGLTKYYFLVFSSLSFVLAIYSYHSFRLLIPLFLLGSFALFYKEFLIKKVATITSLIIFVILVSPVYYSLIFSNSGTGSRLSMVTVFGNTPELEKSIKRLEFDKSNDNILGTFFENRRVVYTLAVVKGYVDNYNPDYLFLHGDGGRQHHAVDMGMLYLISLPFILFGFLVLAKKPSRRIWLLFYFMILAPLPSAISSGSPHPVRAIAMAPVFDILAGVGITAIAIRVFSIRYSVFSIKLKYILYSTFLILFSINLLYYFHQYYVHTSREYGDFWQYGYKEALNYAKENEEKIDKIIFTYKYDQPYVYYLYYNKVDPAWYQNNWNFTGDGVMPRFERKIGKYEFRNVNFGVDRTLKNTLIIGTPDEISEQESIKEIKFLDGATAFRIVKT